MSLYLGIDTSTTATKALLMDDDGGVIAIGRSEYEFQTPRPLWSEQSPHIWWEATIDAIRHLSTQPGVDLRSVGAVGLTGQMHGLVLLDQTRQVLRPAILWNDQRTQVQCDEIRSRVGPERLIQITGNDALAGFTAPKILWVRDDEPEVYQRVSHVLLPKDYVRLMLTDRLAADKADSSGTLLFDLAEREWSTEVLEALDLDPRWFPETFEGSEVTGHIGRSAAQATGLREGVAVVAGAGDQAANGVGVGAVSPDVLAISLGTSGVVFATFDRPIVREPLQAFCHGVPDTWHLMGVMLSAAGSLRWFRDSIAPDHDYGVLDRLAQEVAPGAEGLIFLPYLTGERTPHSDPTARGAFVGLTVRHGIGHLARSVMEGVAFGLRDSVELMDDGVEGADVRVSGGGAVSRLWIQILANVLGLPVTTVNTTESAALGAAVLAAVGDGAFASVAEACDVVVETGDIVEPTAYSDTYDNAYSIYRDLYPALRDKFRRLSDSDGEPAGSDTSSD